MAKPRPTSNRQPNAHELDGDTGADVVELPTPAEVVDPDDDPELDGDDMPPLGEPFALAMGCDLLQTAPGVPGCVACLRCDCGCTFKVNLLRPTKKPCPGCGTVYSHVLVLAPADDREVVAALFDTLDGYDDGDGGELGDDDPELDGDQGDDDPEPDGDDSDAPA